MKFGLLLPHFGPHASSARLVEGVVAAEELGYDSVWVRDHVVYWPHEYEDPDRTWFDPFIVLAAAASRTTRLILGTATLIPYRHPIHDAQMLASLAAVAGPGRVIAGWGRGNDDREFAAVGYTDRRRGARLEEHVEMIRDLWTGDPVDYPGGFYAPFSGVQVSSPGLLGDLPHWYGGGSKLAVERTVRVFDGFLASRIPRDSLRMRVDYMEELSAASGKRTPEVGLVMFVSPGASVEEGMAHVDLDRLVVATRKRHPESSFDSSPDLEGIVFAGPPSNIAGNMLSFAEVGVEHFVLDFRAQFGEWESLMAMAAEEVLPQVRESV
jgi:alkanesulfonate monooxygenase SsuD/methylene tetrahydromethanopterin reductase-like flavin-dependent oxidoreductase (luciferase family)